MSGSSDARYPSLDGRPVLVTGGGSGIGAGIVEHFCAQGSRVAFLELDPVTAAETAAHCESATGNLPVWRSCDLRDIEATRAAVAELAAETGAFRVLVNNAGNDDRHRLEDITPEYWDERFATNLRHQFFVAQAVAGPMAEAGGGSIINLGSISWMMGAAGVIVYTTAKSAVAGLTEIPGARTRRQGDPRQLHRAGLGADAAPGEPSQGNRAGESSPSTWSASASRSTWPRPTSPASRSGSPPTTRASARRRRLSWTGASYDPSHHCPEARGVSQKVSSLAST